MHELSVTEHILEIALRHAQEAKARQITHIYLVIGQLATIVDDSVQFYWELLAEETIAAGAQLHFSRISARFECQSCGRQFGLDDDDLLCPACGSTRINILAGEEFYLDAIDIET